MYVAAIADLCIYVADSPKYDVTIMTLWYYNIAGKPVGDGP